MNIKTKITGLVSIALVAGIVIGGFGQRIMIQQKIRGIFRMGAAGRIFPNPANWLKPENEAQKKAIGEVFAKQSEKLAGIHKRFRKEIDDSFDALDKELDPILTAEQKKRLKDMRPKAPSFPGPGPMRGPRPWMPGRAESMIEDLKKELGLTDDQAVQIQGLFESFWNESKPGFKGGPPAGDPKAFEERMKALDDEIEKVLSDEQKEAFRRFRRERMPSPYGGFPGPGKESPGFPGPDGAFPDE